MKLIIENKIKLNNILLKDFTYLKSKSVYIYNYGSDLLPDFQIIEQKVNLPDKILTKVMQIIEWYSVEPLVIRWYPEPKFYMYTGDYFFKIFGSKV